MRRPLIKRVFHPRQPHRIPGHTAGAPPGAHRVRGAALCPETAHRPLQGQSSFCWGGLSPSKVASLPLPWWPCSSSASSL